MELIDIKGIGESRCKSFEKNGIFSCEDLLNYFPYKYYDFSKTSPFNDDGIVKLIKATVEDNGKIINIRKGLSFITCKMSDEDGNIFNALWFNQTYIKAQLTKGVQFYLYGKNSPTKKNTFIVSITKNTESFKNLGFLPVYHQIDGIGQKIINNSINYCLQSVNLSSFIPNNLLYKYNLMNLNEAYFYLHNPTKNTNFEECLNRIELEKLIPYLAINEYNKIQLKETKKQKYLNIDTLFDEFQKLIPYKLTNDQKHACLDIEKDFKSNFSMNRMLQGDVGSGKTLVAFFGAFVAIKNGYQVAMVAPTEILAKQHYLNSKTIFNNKEIVSTLLTGSMKSTEKKQILKDIESGKSNFIIGTHSIFSESVNYKNLSFIIIDEQHRFGVEQRKLLKNKGLTPDMLVMSATPIPRTLNLILFGDLDISTLKERPKPNFVQTNIVIKSKQNDMIDFLKNKIQNGSKVYVVCSKIDEENDDEEILNYSANNIFKFLQTKFNQNDVGLIHGKQTKNIQEKTINDFREGKIKVLVSTTIVEVGLDIPNADIIVIATPERFGLATLHQLRGRVGRNGEKAFCFCLVNNNLSEKSFKRLSYFKTHNDGFEIAEFDLESRGGGSLFGTNQHGEDNGLIQKLLSKNYALAKEILEQLKSNVKLYVKILEIGERSSKNNIYEKVIFN